MKISVIVATYNGEKYIEQQLLSLMKQSRPVDEVIIFDDCSTDQTVDIVNTFIRQHELSNWSVQVNPTNYGYKKNFIHGLLSGTGDLIFPCDQDDFWHEDKVERMSSIMMDNPEIEVLAGHPHKWFDTIKTNDESIRIKLGRFLDKISERPSCNSGRVEKKELDTHFMRCMPGCVLCIRHDFIHTISKEWFDALPHDKLYVFYSKLTEQYYELDYAVIEWRIHNTSTTHAVSKNSKSRLQELAMENEIIKRLQEYGIKIKMKPQYQKVLYEAEQWNQDRYLLVHDGKISKFFALLGHMSFYVQKRRLFTDLMYGIENHEK